MRLSCGSCTVSEDPQVAKRDAPSPGVSRLACVGCRALLTIDADLSVFACLYCETRQRVQRADGVVSLERV